METMPNGTDTGVKPIQLSFPLPHAPETRVRIHLTIYAKSIVLFLTTTSGESGSAAASMGSFVYAMPNIQNSSQPPLSTPLYVDPSSLDFATRLAKIVARKTGKPTYVGNSISFAGTGLGGTVEEVMDGMSQVLQVVSNEIENHNGQQVG